MPIYSVAGNVPRIHATAFVHPSAVVMGTVRVGPHCYIGPGAVLRGDWVTIEIGAGSNVQDTCVLHGQVGGRVTLAEESHLGHGCIIHSARLGRNVLIGMCAVVGDEVDLGEGSIVGAGAVVPAGLVVPARSLLVGVPARIVGEVRPEMAADKRQGTRWYEELARRSLHEIAEVTRAEAAWTDGAAEQGGAVEWRAWTEHPSLGRQPAGGAEQRQEEK